MAVVNSGGEKHELHVPVAAVLEACCTVVLGVIPQIFKVVPIIISEVAFEEASGVCKSSPFIVVSQTVQIRLFHTNSVTVHQASRVLSDVCHRSTAEGIVAAIEIRNIACEKCCPLLLTIAARSASSYFTAEWKSITYY